MVDSTGKVVQMEGRVSGSQPLTITWYKDNKEISASDKYDISLKNNMAILCVRDSIVSDSGLYTCEVSNEAGKASCQVSLTLSGKNASVSSPKSVRPYAFVGFYFNLLVFLRTLGLFETHSVLAKFDLQLLET